MTHEELLLKNNYPLCVLMVQMEIFFLWLQSVGCLKIKIELHTLRHYADVDRILGKCYDISFGPHDSSRK